MEATVVRNQAIVSSFSMYSIVVADYLLNMQGELERRVAKAKIRGENRSRCGTRVPTNAHFVAKSTCHLARSCLLLCGIPVGTASTV